MNDTEKELRIIIFEMQMKIEQQKKENELLKKQLEETK